MTFQSGQWAQVVIIILNMILIYATIMYFLER
jgi:hypothetical protein